MTTTIPENQRYLRDAFGSLPSPRVPASSTPTARSATSGSTCGRTPSGPSPRLGWLVHRHPPRTEHPLRGKVMRGDLVQVLNGGPA